MIPGSLALRAAPDTRARLTRRAAAMFGAASLAMSSCAAAVGPDGGELIRDGSAAEARADTGLSDRASIAIPDEGPDENGSILPQYGGPFWHDAGTGPDDTGGAFTLYGNAPPPDGG